MADDREGERALELPPDAERLSAEEVVALLAARITHLLDTDRDWLLGKLYRLDVREVDIHAVLQASFTGTTPMGTPPTAEPPAVGLARLVLARHHERAAARARYEVGEIDDEGLRW